MTDLTRGANAALPARRVTATVTCTAPADVSALLVGPDLRVRTDADLVFFNAPEAPGVRWSDGGGQHVDLDLDAVSADAVLIAVSLTGTATFGTVPPPRLRLVTDDGTPAAEFTVPGLGPEKAIIGLEIYRRADRWKVRAVGQGCRLIWEDASRSLAAFRSATEHALTVRNEEIAGRRPRGRFDELMSAADQRLRADAAQLRDELARVEPHVPAEVAPFDAPSWLTWRPRTDLADGALIGRLSTAELPDLRIPLVLRLPWRRAIWISQGTVPGDSAAYAWSLATRFLAAAPPGLVGLEVIDAAGLSGAGWLQGFDPGTSARLLGGGVAVGTGAAERIRRLLDLVDLRLIGGDDENLPGGGPPVRLVVILDAGAALDGEDAHQLLRLVEDGPAAGVPVLLVETDTPAAESVRTIRLRQSCNNLPSSEDAIADSWVGTDWTLTPDVLPDAAGGQAPALLAHVLSLHTRTLTSYD